MDAEILAVCVATERGPKTAVEELRLVRGHGVDGDVHAGTWHRQVSLLEEEEIEQMRQQGLTLEPGAFGENLVTRGADLSSLAIGRRLRVGPDAILQLTQRGKDCHTRCQIYYQVGDCIMPTKGMFARVVRGGRVRPGDRLRTDPTLDRYRYAVVTLSDTSAVGGREDRAGPVVVELVGAVLGGEPVTREVLPDDQAQLEQTLIRLCDEALCDLVVTTGGTGLSPRDVTPEATRAVIHREIPGMAEAMRAGGLAHTRNAMLSRAVCGQRGQSIIVNLSGSPKAVREQLEILMPVLPHALETATGIPQDCARL